MKKTRKLVNEIPCIWRFRATGYVIVCECASYNTLQFNGNGDNSLAILDKDNVE